MERVRKIEGRNLPWMVDARLNGKGERYFYLTAAEADSKADGLRIGRKNAGDESAAMPTKLRGEATDCSQRLAALGATLMEATESFIRHARPKSGTETVENVVGAFLREKAKAGRRPEYLRYSAMCSATSPSLSRVAKRILSAGKKIAAWMDAQKWTLRTRENYRRDLGNLFGFGIKHGLCAGWS